MLCEFREHTGNCSLVPECKQKRLKCCFLCGQCQDKAHMCLDVVEYLDRINICKAG